jgi:predicted N-acetyltransferase YhbS/multimeric flavodoxin WrbA
MRAVIIYWSKTGNTEKVARAIEEGLSAGGVDVSLKRVEDAGEVDFYAYDLVCVGFPSYGWSPPKPMDDFLKRRFRAYRAQGRVKVGAPEVPGKHALILCTYSGPHTGIREALPAVLYAGQFFEHLGLAVLGEWCVVGEYHGSEEASTRGRLGDIRGRPNEEDLRRVREDVRRLLDGMRAQAVTAAGYDIRLARQEDLGLLNGIERAAAARFHQIGLDFVAEMEPLSLDLLQVQQEKGQLWVAVDPTGAAVGFAVAVTVDGVAHLEEVSVRPDHGRRGLGARLVRMVCDWARESGYPAVTLSTFRDVPWNAPFYARLGFQEMTEEELGPGLRAVQAHEMEDGFAMQTRVCMRKALHAHSRRDG